MKLITTTLMSITLSLSACSPVLAATPAMNIAIASSNARATSSSSTIKSSSNHSAASQAQTMANYAMIAILSSKVYRNNKDACKPKVKLNMTNAVAIPCKPGPIGK